MDLNLTNGINNARLKDCDIIRYHNSFMSFEGVKPLYGTFTNRITQGQNRIFNNETAVGQYYCLGKKYGKEEIKIPQDKILYKGDSFVHFFIGNPQKQIESNGEIKYREGANGMVIQDFKNHNLMICSGLLERCSFAILVKNDKIITIHAGSDGLNPNPIRDPRGWYKNADVFCMANYLIGHHLLDNIYQMDVEQMVDMLDSFGFKGFVFFNSNKSKVYIKTSNVVGYSYSINDYNYPKADVVCLINTEGKMQIALRPLSDNRIVSSNFKLWKSQL